MLSHSASATTIFVTGSGVSSAVRDLVPDCSNSTQEGSLTVGTAGSAGAEVASVELELGASLAASEALLASNEQIRKEAEALLRERAEEERAHVHVHVVESFVPTEAEPAMATHALAEGASSPAALIPSHPSPAAGSAARSKRNQRAAKARRIFKQAAKLARANDASSSVSSWSLVGMDMSKLARVALEISKTAEALRTSDFFADLGERQLTMMASAGQRRKLPRYSVLYREAATATCFYVLTGGAMLEHSLAPAWKTPKRRPGERRSQQPRDQRTIAVERRPGCRFALFGLEALVGRPRQSTMSVVEEVDVLKFPAAELNILRDGADKIARKVFNAFLEGELAHTWCFRGVTPSRLKQVIALFDIEDVVAGTTIFEAGSPGDRVFLLMHGAVSLLRGQLSVATLTAEQGQATSMEHGMPVFGELAMVDRRPRSTKAVATVDSKLLVLPLEQWAACTLAVPDLKSRLANNPLRGVN